MRTLYLDLGMGAAGDMLTAALYELIDDKDEITRKLESLNIPGTHIEFKKAVKCGITGTHADVVINGERESEDMHEHHHDQDYHHEHDHHHEHDNHHEHEHHEEHTHHHGGHHHSSMHDIEHIVRDHMNLAKQIADDVMAVYGIIAEAESHVHGVEVNQIHFHEVGTMDAIADIAAACILMRELNPDLIVASPIHVGSGQVKCAHGILPVPAPATAHILHGIPCYGKNIQSELCTPTGAALVKYFVNKFGPMPVMSISKVGYGMGNKDFEVANCVRAVIGEQVAEQTNVPDENTSDIEDYILELDCNVDDMTGEEIGFAIERILGDGALEVFAVPVVMKKSRPGQLIIALCKPNDEMRIVESVFRNTTTIGIRKKKCERYVLSRTICEEETPYGTVHKKVSEGYGVKREKYEYEDLASIARNELVSIRDVVERIGK